MSDDKPMMLRADGQVDGRGHSDGSKRNRFAAGDGRPRPGRPKGASDDRTIVQKVRDMPVIVKTRSGKRTRINTREAVMLALRTKALAGDVKAIDNLMKRFERYDVPSTEGDRTPDLLAEDKLILETARRRGVLPPSDDPDGEA